MKRLAAAVLIVHVLLSAWAPSGLAELIRLPSLNAHYAEHFKESGGTMGWGSFLLLHYTDPSHTHKDASKHGALPFHSAPMDNPVVLPPTELVSVNRALEPERSHCPVQVAEVGEWPGRSVFHPPKA